MANIQARDALNTVVFLKATGAGTDADPFVPEYLMPNGVEAALTAIQDLITPNPNLAASATGDLYQRLRAIAENAAPTVAIASRTITEAGGPVTIAANTLKGINIAMISGTATATLSNSSNHPPFCYWPKCMGASQQWRFD